MVYTICIGSNVNRKENLALARKRLSELFPNIRFSAEADTEPLFSGGRRCLPIRWRASRPILMQVKSYSI